MADDWNWPHSEGIFDPNIQTPTFDRIAREGVMFTNAFVASPSCTPCRASLLTGRHPWELETGVHLWGALLPESEIYQRVAGRRPGEELYSIKRDPYQLQNLAEDPEFAEIKAMLSKDLDNE
jgi:arylsulfatase A-like enzyme